MHSESSVSVSPWMTCHACPRIQHLGIPFCSLLPSSFSVYYIIILAITDFLPPLYGTAASGLLTSHMNYYNSLQGAFPVPCTLLFNAFCYHPWPIFYTPFSHVTSVASVSVKSTSLIWPFLLKSNHATFFSPPQCGVSALVKPRVFLHLYLRVSAHQLVFL